jgi:hypothetical protein
MLGYLSVCMQTQNKGKSFSLIFSIDFLARVCTCACVRVVEVKERTITPNEEVAVCSAYEIVAAFC